MSRTITRKKGQATVEFILLIAILVPVFLLVMATIKDKVFKPTEAWFQQEIGSQVRYGYSASYFGEAINLDRISETSGLAPMPYGPVGNVQKLHPLHKVKAGWVQ